MTHSHQYWGKYRGKVWQNVDPLEIGRLQVDVPQVPGTRENWAMPCVPYAGFQVGFFAMPERNANVWVEFEGGDPSFPIWTGCFWSEGEAPLPFAADPQIKAFKTPSNVLILDDTPETGGATLMSEPPAVNDIITLKFSSEGVLLTAPPGIFNMSIEEGITIEFPDALLAMTEAGVLLTLPPAAVALSEEAIGITAPDVAIGAEEAFEVGAGADITMAAGAAFNLESASAEITAAVAEWLGDLNVTGAFQVEGGVTLIGATAIVGEHNIIGATQIEGDFNVVGAVQIEGGLVVLGVILMDGMPVMTLPF